MDITAIDKFEYKIESFHGFSPKKIIEEMNKLGNDGWELITINSGASNTSKQYIFKRKQIINQLNSIIYD